MPNPSASASDAKDITHYCKNDFVNIPLSSTVGEAIELVRRGAKRGNILYLYVTDSDEKLKGVVPIRSVLIANDSDPIATIMSSNIVFLSSSSQLQHAYKVFSESHFLSLPVVSPEGKILGVVHAHELIQEEPKSLPELFEERSRGELFALLGIKAEDQNSGALKILLGRLPWLAFNLTGGLISAAFIHYLGPRLKEPVTLLALVPLLLLISESLGMQTASMIIAHLHKSTSSANAKKFIVKEIFIAFLVGIACATLLAIPIFLWTRSVVLASTIAMTLTLGSVMVATVASAIPHLFRRLHVDPRLAAGPVILALADPMTLLLFLSIALALQSN